MSVASGSAEIWAKTGDLNQITDHRGEDDVVRAMVRRYQQHCPATNDDRRALRAMALADGDRELLTAMLKPEHNNQLESFLTRVRHRYAAVQHASMGRLHDVPAAFFREDMRDRPDEEVFQLVKRALRCTEARIEKQQAYHLSLQDLCGDTDYGVAVVRKACWLFWLDEIEAWAWITARMVEALPYGETKITELADEADWFKPRLGDMGKKRLAILAGVRNSDFSIRTRMDFRNLLNDDIEGRGYLRGTLVEDKFRDEVKASWVWYQGDLLRREERYDEALLMMTPVVKLLKQSKSPGLRRAVADTALAISYQFCLKKAYPKERDATTMAVMVDLENPRAWREHGTAHNLLNQIDKAIEFHNKALDIDSNDANAWYELGNDHSHLKQYDKAIEFHKKALDIDPNDAATWRELFSDYQFLGLYDNAVSALEKALHLDPDNSRVIAWKGYLAMLQGQIEAAEDEFANALIADQNEEMALGCAGALAYRLGSLDEALTKYKQAVTVNPKIFERHHDLAAIQRLKGETSAAETNLTHAKTMIPKNSSDLFIQAKLKALTEEPESALKTLEASIAERPGDREWAPFCPAFHSLRNHPRFRELTGNLPGSNWSELEAW